MTKFPSKFFALGHDGKVELLCEDRGSYHGFSVRKFWVINGAWEGSYAPTLGVLQVHKTGSTRAAQLLWRSDEEPPGRDYNEQIAWVQERVTDPWKHRWAAIWEALCQLPRYRLVMKFELRPPKRREIQNYEDDDIPF